jgi:hypothetical protein
MAKAVYIKDADIRAGGNRAALAVTGAGREFKSVLGLMDHDRREDLARVTAMDERYKNIPETVEGRVGTTNVRNYSGSKAKLLKDKSTWASVSVLTPVGGFQRADLTGELRWVMQTLLAAASPFASSGRYRSSFRYVVGGVPQRGIPRGDKWTLAGVTNVAAYASALENMREHKVFRRTFTKVQARARLKNYDARMFYLTGVSEGRKYPSPMIQIGQLNSMRGKTGLQFRQRPVGAQWNPNGWRRRPWDRR